LIRLLRAYKKFEGRFLLLFALLVLTLLLTPYLQDHLYLIAALYIAVPLAGVHAASFNRRNLVVAVILGLPAIVMSADQNLGTSFFPLWLTHISAVSFYGYTAAILLAFVLREKSITANTVYGALSVYLLLGMTWSFAYGMAEALSPGSFYMDAAYDTDGVLDRKDFVYFSFVTLTTLGYGDILPITAHTRSLAILEAVCGVLFTGTLVASLIGRMGSRSEKANDK
jgi:hypothetical protein